MHSLHDLLNTTPLTRPELIASALNGEVYQLGAGFVPLDVPDSTATRALTLAGTSLRLIVARGSAAWVHGALAYPPLTVQFCVDIRARASLNRRRGSDVSEVVIDDDEIMTISGVRVTTPLRTALDLARSPDEFTARQADAVAVLLDRADADMDVCRDHLDRVRHVGHRERTLERIEASLPGGYRHRVVTRGQPALTRYTS